MIARGARSALLALALALSTACTEVVDTSALDQGCANAEKGCDRKCVSRSDPRFGCASASCAPCAVPNATAVCSPEGTCGIGACDEGYLDCDADATNGCETPASDAPSRCK